MEFKRFGKASRRLDKWKMMNTKISFVWLYRKISVQQFYVIFPFPIPYLENGNLLDPRIGERVKRNRTNIYWVLVSVLRSHIFLSIFYFHNYLEIIIPLWKGYRILLEKVHLIQRSHSNLKNSNSGISAFEQPKHV